MNESATTAMLVSDSVTTLDATTAGRVVVADSHCGVYAAYLAARAGARAVVLNDASVGKDRAGIGGLSWLAGFGLPAAAVDYASARIGDGADMLARGVISHVNAVASDLGCRPGQSAAECAALLQARAPRAAATIPAEEERRYALQPARAGAIATAIAIWAIDSISLARPGDDFAILVTGSHGGLLGGDPATALACDALAAVFNDAGGGIDGAGYTRLPALDARRIAGATVAASSARIGDGRSTWNDGIVSRVNATAAGLGARAGMTTAAFADCVVAARSSAAS
jgi:hypothetical protein